MLHTPTPGEMRHSVLFLDKRVLPKGLGIKLNRSRSYAITGDCLGYHSGYTKYLTSIESVGE